MAATRGTQHSFEQSVDNQLWHDKIYPLWILALPGLQMAAVAALGPTEAFDDAREKMSLADLVDVVYSLVRGSLADAETAANAHQPNFFTYEWCYGMEVWCLEQWAMTNCRELLI